MHTEFYQGNRERLYAQMKENALLVLFSGTEMRKTNDEFYPFYTHRNFLYLTGLDQKELALIVQKDGKGQVHEKIYILPPDMMTERWSGARIKAAEAADRSGIQDVGYVASFETDLHRLATSGNYQFLYLDLFRVSPTDRDEPAHHLLKEWPRTIRIYILKTLTRSFAGCAPLSSHASWRPCAAQSRSPARALLP